MKQSSKERLSRYSDAGSALFIVAGAMVLLLGVSALAIDLVSFYVGRNEAQRAADAGALAGASIFVAQSCTTGTGGCVAGGAQEAPATQRAIDVAAQNLVAGQAPSSSTVDVSFSYPTPEDPQITVTVHRDSTKGNALPTFFAKIFGFTTFNVSASATAEAFNSSGGSVPVGSSCLRPFLVPNCDSGHPISNLSPNFATNANTKCNATPPNYTDAKTVACPSGVSGTCYPSYFFQPNNQGYSGIIVNPGVYNPNNPAAGGIIGEPWQLHSENNPSQWYLLALGGSQSGSLLRSYIETCASQVIACNTPLNSANGKKVGPVDQGINALINANGNGANNGQDMICAPTTSPACTSPPFPITGGANNPNSNLVGKTFYSPSSSIATVAVYDGHQLASGGESNIPVLGYMQLFIQEANPQGPDDLIDTIILNVSGCGSTSGNGEPITSQGGSPIPIRLIRPAGQ
jgi:hypothetical protein